MPKSHLSTSTLPDSLINRIANKMVKDKVTDLAETVYECFKYNRSLEDLNLSESVVDRLEPMRSRVCNSHGDFADCEGSIRRALLEDTYGETYIDDCEDPEGELEARGIQWDSMDDSSEDGTCQYLNTTGEVVAIYDPDIFCLTIIGAAASEAPTIDVYEEQDDNSSEEITEAPDATANEVIQAYSKGLNDAKAQVAYKNPYPQGSVMALHYLDGYIIGGGSLGENSYEPNMAGRCVIDEDKQINNVGRNDIVSALTKAGIETSYSEKAGTGDQEHIVFYSEGDDAPVAVWVAGERKLFIIEAITVRPYVQTDIHTERKVVIDALTPDEFNTLLKCVRGKDFLENHKALEEKLMGMFIKDMPYGTAKARTGDPYQWIDKHLSYLFGGM